jgi:pimeloyl-ACP methyl ester carboxylesterase
MRFRILALSILLVMLTGLLACGGSATPTATATVIPTELDPTATPIAVATATATLMDPAPTTAPVEVEEISFQSSHFTLVGDLQNPATEGKHPVIIMVHGDGGIDRYDSGKYRPIMERFLRAGYAVFSWDKPGTGESTGEFVDGAWIITDRATILVDAVELLKEHPAIDPERIGVWGISQAGVVMPMALTMADDIAFMIVVSGPGVDSIDQTAYLIGQQLLCQGYSEEEAKLAEQSFAGLCKATTYQEYRDNKANLVQFPYTLNFTGKDITPEENWSPWDRDVDAFFNPIEVIEQTAIPVLTFFGEKDTQVDPFQGAQAYEQALQKAANQNSHVELVPGVNHVLVPAETGCMDEHSRRVYAPEYLDLMEEWLVQLPIPLPPLDGSGGGLIAFTSERDGNAEIYTMNGDGGDQRRLTDDPAMMPGPSGRPMARRSPSHPTAAATPTSM